MSDDLTRDGLKNQGKGVTDEVKGRVRNTVGGITGDSSEQLKGKAEELKGASKSMYRSMNERQLEEMASTKRKGKPGHKSKS